MSARLRGRPPEAATISKKMDIRFDFGNEFVGDGDKWIFDELTYNVQRNVREFQNAAWLAPPIIAAAAPMSRIPATIPPIRMGRAVNGILDAVKFDGARSANLGSFFNRAATTHTAVQKPRPVPTNRLEGMRKAGLPV